MVTDAVLNTMGEQDSLNGTMNAISVESVEFPTNWTENLNNESESFSNISNNGVTFSTAIPLPRATRSPLILILETYTEYRASQKLGLYVLPVFIILGSFGNILSFLVMIKPKMRRSSTCVYMAAIATADMMVLCFSGIPEWLGYALTINPQLTNDASCISFNFLQYFSFDFSVWLLVAMTIERFIAIHFPLKACQYATVSRARKVTIFLFCFMFFLNSHFFFSVGISSNGYCAPAENFENFHDTIWPWVDATIYSFSPFLMLLIFNVLIICDTRRAGRLRTSLGEGGHQYTTNYKNQQRFNEKLTVMLLSVSFMFLIMSAPKAIIFLIRRQVFNFYLENGGLNFHGIAVYNLTTTVSDIFLYANHSLNFLLYCISGDRFRRELKTLMLCNRATMTRAQTLTSIYSQRRGSNQTNDSVSSVNRESRGTQVFENYV